MLILKCPGTVIASISTFLTCYYSINISNPMKRLSLIILASITLAACSPAPEKPLATIGIVTDIHYFRDREPGGSRYYALSKEKLSEAVDVFNEQGVDFTVSLGDTFDPDTDTYQDIADEFARLDAPVYKVLGNHDCIAPYGSEKQNAVLALLGIENPYYSVKGPDNLRLIFIDGNDVSIQSTAPGTPERAVAEKTMQELEDNGAPMARPYNGMLSEEQTRWLVSELDAARNASDEVLVFSHMPLEPRDIDAALWDGEKIDSLLQSYPNVRAVFSGHHHSGAYHSSGKIMHYTFRGMIEGTENHYGIVRIYKDRIDVTEYPLEMAR